MATYYVRTDGSNGNTGLGSTSGQAWQTIQKALGATGIGSGDTLYIAPGVYREAVTIGGTYSATTYITGDPTGSQFSGVAAGEVRITGFSTDTLSTSLGTVITATSKNNLYWSNIFFQNQIRVVEATTCNNWTFEKCYMQSIRATGGTTATGSTISMTTAAGTALGLSCTKCIFDSAFCFFLTIPKHTATYDSGMTWTDCFFNVPNNIVYPAAIYTSPGAGTTFPTGGVVTNCTFTGGSTTFGVIVHEYGWNITTPFAVKNCMYLNAGRFLQTATTGSMVETYNRYPNATLTGVTASGTSSAVGVYGMDLGYTTLVGLPPVYAYGSTFGSVNAGFGVSSGAPATDMFGVTWTGATPDAGAVTYRNLSTLTGYQPTERNASAITIAPGSTSQSVELYLGATGLTFATSGLAAYYVRNQSAPVAITLVTQTPTGAWSSGGFAEISSSLVPGVYRLDVPNAAFAAGASDVTIVVRGASGTNGAVLTVTLSSGGLTAAQTAAAVWDATVAGYNTATNFGGVMMETNNVVNGIDSEVGDIPSNVWQELRANHTTAGTFGQYVNAELVTPVTSAALVRMGPFEVKADGLGASDPLDIQKGAQHGVDIQCVDNNGAGIDITSATVTAKIYNSGATLVSTLACTATYAADGRAQFTLTTTVTNTPGTYTATITRTTGASDTQIFGPLRIYVRDI
jgi:hypothetical protein